MTITWLIDGDKVTTEHSSNGLTMLEILGLLESEKLRLFYRNMDDEDGVFIEKEEIEK